MPELVYTTREAIEMHGGRDKLRRVDGASYLLPTGAGVALRNGDPHDEIFIPPPTDRKLLLERRRRYHGIGLQAAELDFAKLKAAIRGDGPPPQWGAEAARRYECPGFTTPEEMIPVLQRIRSVVMVERAALARINADLARLPETMAERQRLADREQLQQEMDAAEMQRFQMVREVVDSIHLDDVPQTDGVENGNAMDDSRRDLPARPTVPVRGDNRKPTRRR